jgi:hypothetical protein
MVPRLALFAGSSTIILLTRVSAADTKEKASYDTVLAIVIVELVFAFMVGIVCIIFSFNLFRTIQNSKDTMENLAVGDLPRIETGRPSYSSNHSIQHISENMVYKTFNGAAARTPSVDNVSEMDSEVQLEGTQPPTLLQSFASFVKIW